jgi:hypothetical protein
MLGFRRDKKLTEDTDQGYCKSDREHSDLT